MAIYINNKICSKDTCRNCVLLMAIKTLIWYSVTETLLRLNMCLLLLGYLVGFILILDAKFLYFLQIFSLGLDYSIPIKALVYQLEL